MRELTIEEIDSVAGGFLTVNWGQMGNAMVAFGGAALTLGNFPVAAGFGIAAAVCYGLAD